MQKKSVDIISCFSRFFAKKVEKKTPLFDKIMSCIIVQIQTLVSNCTRIHSGDGGGFLPLMFFWFLKLVL